MAASSRALMIDFEDATPGNLSGEWADFGDNRSQKNLWQVKAGIGRDGSNGARLFSDAELSYRILNRHSTSGNDFQLRVDMKLTISSSATKVIDDPVIAIVLSDSPEVYEGKKQYSMFVRQEHGKRFGCVLNGISPDGFLENKKIGLPKTLPDGDDTATSDWFTMVLDFSDQGNDIWKATASMLDGDGKKLLSASQTVTKPSGEITLYPCIQVDWSPNALKDSAVTDVIIDNIRLNEE